MRDIALLVNPTSGRGRAREAARRAARRLRRDGASVTELVGTDGAHALRLAEHAVAAGTDALVACGGDGIMNTALRAAVGTTTPIGLVPAGTGNDYARMLGLHGSEPESAARVVLAGRTGAIDAGRCGEHWFGTVLACGFDAKVNERTNRMSWPRGKWRYNLAVLAELARLRPLDYTLELDGEPWRTSAVLVAIGNGPSYGGGMRICPGSSLVDGWFDVTVIGPVAARRLVRVLPTVYSGGHVAYPQVTTVRARRVSVSTPEVTAYGDGEPLARLPLTAECVPRAVNVLVPEEPR
ncbi:sphingosine kinase [Actinopolyspora erythraea]|uniref:Sphingosine kinase n=1 Tax=Actinopolyspora erythraea TaxID=414996 RepID=A0A099D8F8_9ACTN|nr:diacylglycerol kinase [Actinopolyspora erythraea]ASU81263.1 sphingosine kinase [Actinopolyspora erythraea]KGI82314.1 sphingosine kinase [Actinopolyspora erythraea]